MLSNSPLLFWAIVISLVGLLIWAGRRRSIRREVERESVARVQREKALKHLGTTEAGGGRGTLARMAGVLHLSSDGAAELLGDMEERGLVSVASGEIRLTPAGRAAAGLSPPS